METVEGVSSVEGFEIQSNHETQLKLGILVSSKILRIYYTKWVLSQLVAITYAD